MSIKCNHRIHFIIFSIYLFKYMVDAFFLRLFFHHYPSSTDDSKCHYLVLLSILSSELKKADMTVFLLICSPDYLVYGIIQFSLVLAYYVASQIGTYKKANYFQSQLFLFPICKVTIGLLPNPLFCNHSLNNLLYLQIIMPLSFSLSQITHRM